MSFGIADDLGVWVVVRDGSFATEELAQAECDRRNFEDGCADESGAMKMMTIPEFNTYRVRHGSRADCTCGRVAPGTA
jgi:hypothetical protein